MGKSLYFVNTKNWNSVAFFKRHNGDLFFKQAKLTKFRLHIRKQIVSKM